MQCNNGLLDQLTACIYPFRSHGSSCDFPEAEGDMDEQTEVANCTVTINP